MLSKNAIISKFNDATNGLYRTGQVEGIGSNDHRTLVQDFMDSLVGFDDQESTTVPVIQVFYETPGMGTATADYNWSSYYDNIGLLVADYDDITIDFQNRVVGSKATLLVKKTISGDVTLTIPAMQKICDTATSTSIVLSGSTDELFRIDFFTTANSGFIQVGSPSDSYKKVIHKSETEVWAILGPSIYKSTNNGISFTLIETFTAVQTNFTLEIIDFDLQGVYIWCLCYEIDVNDTPVDVQINGSDDSGATFALTADSPFGGGNLLTCVGIYNSSEMYFGGEGRANLIAYGNTSTGGSLANLNISSGSTQTIKSQEFALSTDLFLLHSQETEFKNQISKRTGVGTFAKTATAPPNTVKLLSIDFASSTLGIVVGYDSVNEPIIYKTTDAGATWTAETISASIGIVRKVRAVTATSFIVCGDSGIGYSIDSGDTWTYYETPVNGTSLSAWDANDILIGTTTPALFKGFGDSFEDTYDYIERPDSNAIEILGKTVSISSAEILSLNSTPKELIAAPGSGKMIDVMSVDCYLDYNSVAYATNTDLFISYGSSGAELHITSFQLAGGSFDYVTKLVLDNQVRWNLTVRENTPISAFVLAGNPTAGNSTVKIYLTYRIITI